MDVNRKQHVAPDLHHQHSSTQFQLHKEASQTSTIVSVTSRQGLRTNVLRATGPGTTISHSAGLFGSPHTGQGRFLANAKEEMFYLPSVPCGFKGDNPHWLGCNRQLQIERASL